MSYDHKIIVFTDIHITEVGKTIIGLDPMERFLRGMAHALEHHPDAARIVVTGDLAHHGKPEEYDRLKQALEGCPMPVSLMLGNHDRRATFLETFDDVPRTDGGFVQSYADLGDWRLVMLDTLDEEAPIEHSGLLCEERLEWMSAALGGAGDRKRILFTHHPTFVTGFGSMDEIGLRNRDELRNRLQRHPNIRQIISGHVHRTISSETAGIPSAVFKSPCHQMPMLLGDAGSSHSSVDEPGAYGILLLREEGVVVHSEDFELADGSFQDF